MSTNVSSSVKLAFIGVPNITFNMHAPEIVVHNAIKVHDKDHAAARKVVVQHVMSEARKFYECPVFPVGEATDVAASAAA